MNKLIIILFISLLSAIGFSYHFYKKYNNEKKQKENISLLYSDEIKKVETYRNKQGDLISKNEALILDNKNIRNLANQRELEWLNKFDNLKKNYSNLEYAYKIKSVISDSLRSKLEWATSHYIDEKGDTIEFKAFKWEHKDLFGDFKLTEVTPDSVDFKYSIPLQISGVMYWERKHPILWVFSKKEYKSEVYSDNPHVKISELVNIKIEKKK